MNPATPVLPSQPHTHEFERVYAKDQPQYRPLPSIHCSDGRVITRWMLSWRERLRVLWTGSLFLQQLTFNDPLQPQFPSVEEPEVTITRTSAE